MTNETPETLPDGRVIVGYGVVNGLPMVRETCDLCQGAGEHFDITSADKVNAGPFANRCPRCSGAGERIVAVYPEHPPVDTGSLCDPGADLGWWAESDVPASEPGRVLTPDTWWRK